MLLIMGPAGAGKTEQAKRLVKSMNLNWISTGHLLREAMNQPEIKEAMNRGELLDDNFVENVVSEAIKASPDPSRVILDGFPRNVEQSKWLFSFLDKNDLKVSCVLNLQLPLEEAQKRLFKRGRVDDNHEAIKKRFEEYQAVTLPMIDYYNGHEIPVCTIDGQGTRDEVEDRIKEDLKTHVYKNQD